jgi:hypothetical protein
LRKQFQVSVELAFGIGKFKTRFQPALGVRWIHIRLGIEEIGIDETREKHADPEMEVSLKETGSISRRQKASRRAHSQSSIEDILGRSSFHGGFKGKPIAQADFERPAGANLMRPIWQSCMVSGDQVG